ncbi:hypothetical protein B0H17DRAFT_1128658 [Mycena rosella]|uniref:Uncharacterized protein n=1 Tax=Mycena rosella TaxID=1033263 RepID=A0AAD7DYA6_MYCRO|nr:hypothetical protein B0H17DRAFT_1128658 [Mycena rosella]
MVASPWLFCIVLAGSRLNASAEHGYTTAAGYASAERPGGRTRSYVEGLINQPDVLETEPIVSLATIVVLAPNVSPHRLTSFRPSLHEPLDGTALPAAATSGKAKGKTRQADKMGPNPKPLTTIPKKVVAAIAPESLDVPPVNDGAPPSGLSNGTIVPSNSISTSLLSASSYSSPKTSTSASVPLGGDGSPSARSSGARSAPASVLVASPTPSFTSILNPPSSTAPPSVRSLSVHWDQSISNASQTSCSMEEYPFLFQGPARVFGLYDKPLYSSVERYHEVYNPHSTSQYDPLIRFRASDGLLPQRSLEESISLCNVLIRYTSPHLELIWEDLSSGITGLQALEHPSAYMRSLEVDKSRSPRYCIAPEILVVFGHMCLAAQQVLDGRTVIAYAFLTIQTRLRFMDIHIKKYLNSIQHLLTNSISDERISSADSTVTEVRSDFYCRSTLPELYKLFARPEHFAAVWDVAPGHTETGLKKLEVEGQIPAQIYKARTPRPLPTIREATPPAGAERNATRDSGGDARVRDAPPHLSIPMPASISAAPHKTRHAILSLPEVGQFPGRGRAISSPKGLIDPPQSPSLVVKNPALGEALLATPLQEEVAAGLEGEAEAETMEEWGAEVEAAPVVAATQTRELPKARRVNHKLNLSSVPSWDREGTTAISYLAKMSKLAKLGEKMRRSLGNIAANLFTRNADAWWCLLTDTDQLYFSQDWLTMLLTIREQFLTEAWHRDHSREYEEMRFR